MNKQIAAQPGAHNLRCVFRFCFLPRSGDCTELLHQDPNAFEYLYSQSTADLLNDRLNTLLNAETSLRLSALRLQQQALSSTDLAGSTSNAAAAEKNSGRHSITSRLKKRPALLTRSSVDSKSETDSNSLSNVPISGQSKHASTSSSASLSCSSNTGSMNNDNTNNVYGLSLDQMIASAKSIVKQMERSYGLESFVPNALLNSMKKKELIKLILHFYKQNQMQLIPNTVNLLASYASSNNERKSSKDTSSIDSPSIANLANNINSNSTSALVSTASTSTTTTATTTTATTTTNNNQTNKLKSSELKRTIVTEQSVKLCFMNLLCESDSFGVKVFNVKKITLDYQSDIRHKSTIVFRPKPGSSKSSSSSSSLLNSFLADGSEIDCNQFFDLNLTLYLLIQTYF